MGDRLDLAAPFSRLLEKLFLARYRQKLIMERNRHPSAGPED